MHSRGEVISLTKHGIQSEPSQTLDLLQQGLPTPTLVLPPLTITLLQFHWQIIKHHINWCPEFFLFCIFINSHLARCSFHYILTSPSSSTNSFPSKALKKKTPTKQNHDCCQTLYKEVVSLATITTSKVLEPLSHCVICLVAKTLQTFFEHSQVVDISISRMSWKQAGAKVFEQIVR